MIFTTIASWESEGFDRTTLEYVSFTLSVHSCLQRHLITITLRLPGSTNKLVEAVIATNPSTVVVIQSGAPVEMPWVDKLEHGALLQVGCLFSMRVTLFKLRLMGH